MLQLRSNRRHRLPAAQTLHNSLNKTFILLTPLQTRSPNILRQHQFTNNKNPHLEACLLGLINSNKLLLIQFSSSSSRYALNTSSNNQCASSSSSSSSSRYLIQGKQQVCLLIVFHSVSQLKYSNSNRYLYLHSKQAANFLATLIK